MNWAAIPVAKVEGTIFCELNEEDMMQRLKDQIDEFEETFKTKAPPKKTVATEAPKGTMPRKQPPKEQVLETGRIRNVGEQGGSSIYSSYLRSFILTSQVAIAFASLFMCSHLLA